MKPVKRGAYALLFVLCVVTSFVMPSGVASATSIYDNAYQTTDRLTITDPYRPECQGVDISANWAAYILDSSRWINPSDANNPNSAMSQARSSFQAAITDEQYGTWAVSQRTAVDGYETVRVIWTQEPSSYLQWQTWGATLRPFVHYLNIICNDQAGDSSSDYKVVAQEASLNQSGRSISEPDEGLKNFFVHSNDSNFNPSYPVGYEGELLRIEQPATRHGALGDSYSSAEGNPSFETGTNVGNVNGCHRSLRAYPRLLQSELDLGPTAFVACSGATTANITSTGQWNEPPQIDALSDDTEVVTLTIGGNDVGFTDYAIACSVACGYGSIPYNTIMGKINDPDFKADLVATYEAILDEAPNADLYVADYPYIAEENATTCWGLDFSGAYDVQTALNDVIFDAVVEVGLNSNHIFMVQTNYTGSPFEGGELCGSGTPLFYGLVAPPNVEYSLHPNVAGQAAYAEVFEEAMS